MGGAWSALRGALGMFTLLPVAPTMELDERTNRRIILALPWAGLVCGLAAAAIAALVVVCGAGSLLAAMAGLATLAGITGAMHLDGVADTTDGLASRKPADEALLLMKRSDIGPMGVATVVLVLLLQACALASAPLGGAAGGAVGGDSGPDGWRLVACLAMLPVVGRVSALLATVEGVPGARPQGFGALFTGITRARDAAWCTAAVLVLAWAAGAVVTRNPLLALAFAVSAVVAWLVAARWQQHLLRRLGGLTGDTFGSLIEVSQTTFVVVLALLLGLATRLGAA